MSDPQSVRQVRLLQTRRAEPQEITGPDEASPPPAPPAMEPVRWRWFAGGIVLALVAAALTATDLPVLAALPGLCSAVCFIAHRSRGAGRRLKLASEISPETSKRIRISDSRREGRHGVLWRSWSTNCPACHNPLGEEATTTCTSNKAHVIHRRCKDLMQGKCPKCGNPLR